jgi:ABC-type phosphate transport system permease subunit
VVNKKVALSIIYIVAWLFVLFTLIIPIAVGIASLPFFSVNPEGFTGSLILWQEVSVILFFVPCTFLVSIIAVFSAIANS